MLRGPAAGVFSRSIDCPRRAGLLHPRIALLYSLLSPGFAQTPFSSALSKDGFLPGDLYHMPADFTPPNSGPGSCIRHDSFLVGEYPR